ncbi:MAG: VWA domain-containing protein, partial [Chitinophagaceae bacterium]
MKYSFLLTASTLLTGLFNSSCGQVSSQNPGSTNATPPETTTGGAVSWMAMPGNKYYLNSAKELYVYISLKGNEGVKQDKRVPLNISIVLDRSGSMRGDKIAYAKKAANFLVNQLAAEDIVSIVNYDDRVE